MLKRIWVFSILLFLSACAGGSFDVPAWDQAALQQNGAYRLVSSSAVQIVFIDQSGSPIYSGSGVVLRHSDVNGFPAILTIRHVGDLVGQGLEGSLKIQTADGQVLGDARPIYTGYPTNSQNDDVIALAVEPATVPDPSAWKAIQGASIAPTLSEKDLYGQVSQPFGVVSGDSGSGWFDKAGNLIGITSRTMDNDNKTPKISAIGLAYPHLNDVGNYDNSVRAPQQTPITAPSSDIVLVETLDTPYLRNLFPSAFAGSIDTDEAVYPGSFASGFGGFIQTYYQAHMIVSNDSCMQQIDTMSGSASDGMENPKELLSSPACENILSILNQS